MKRTLIRLMWTDKTDEGLVDTKEFWDDLSNVMKLDFLSDCIVDLQSMYEEIYKETYHD